MASSALQACKLFETKPAAKSMKPNQLQLAKPVDNHFVDSCLPASPSGCVMELQLFGYAA